MKKILVQRRSDGYLTALIENGKLIELIKDSKEGSFVGNIYAGIVKKINTGFVFLDIGLNKQAFLDTNDMREKGLFADDKLTVKQGDTLVVQITKDGLGEKGPVATTNISAIGRFVVLSKSVLGDKISISRKITDDMICDRLNHMGKTLVPPGFSAIFRTEAGTCQDPEIAREIGLLISKIGEQNQWAYAKPPATLLTEPVIVKTLREITTDDVDEIVTDCPTTYNEIINHFCPIFEDFSSKIRLLQSDTPIFDHFFIATQMEKICDKRIWLKSGAFIVIEQTEACVVIDVNTGKFMGKQNDVAKLKVNMEAAKEIAYQLRLRNLSGIIIIDFIRMKSQNDTESLTAYLQTELARDRIAVFVAGVTPLGLMEVTRKRTRAAHIDGYRRLVKNEE